MKNFAFIHFPYFRGSDDEFGNLSEWLKDFRKLCFPEQNWDSVISSLELYQKFVNEREKRRQKWVLELKEGDIIHIDDYISSEYISPFFRIKCFLDDPFRGKTAVCIRETDSIRVSDYEPEKKESYDIYIKDIGEEKNIHILDIYPCCDRDMQWYNKYYREYAEFCNTMKHNVGGDEVEPLYPMYPPSETNKEAKKKNIFSRILRK